MKQRKNGFTLIELLAVIIILAAIALIIAPLVIDVIKEQQMKTFKESINGILRSSRLEIVNSGLSFPATFTYSDGKLLSPTGKELKVTGKIPNGTGVVRYNQEDNIDLGINDQIWCGTYSNSNKEVEITEFNGECNVMVYTPEKCFQVEDYEKIEYTVNQAVCVSFLTANHYNEEEATETCAGGINNQGRSLEIEITNNFFTIEELESAGAITVTKRTKDGAIINKYNKNDSDCPVDIIIPETINGKVVKAIGENAFLENYNNGKPEVGDSKLINSVIFPSGLEVIEEGAFRAIGYYKGYGSRLTFNAITTLDFSKATNLRVIGLCAFSQNQLTSVNLKGLSKLKVIGYASFLGNQITTIDISDLTSVEIIDDEAFYDNQITDVDLSGLTNLVTIGQHAFFDNGLTNVNFRNLNNLKRINICAFCENSLTNVDLSNLPKLELIQDSGFAYNLLTNLNLSNTPNLIIESRSFNDNQLPEAQAIIYARNSDGSEDRTTIVSYGGAERENVTIPNGVRLIEEDAFDDSQLKNITIPNSVTTIKRNAFFGNELTSVIIPSSVTTIGSWAFGSNKLTSVTIKGKSSSTEFTSYPTSTPFGWASGYSDSNIIWNG